MPIAIAEFNMAKAKKDVKTALTESGYK